ncbi:glyceraldehyde 3-phosphate reductase [Dictyobacter alpinus]|uniref:Glyceraldehyde 3-phosphate reductase n=1 Tax=Dictyobacter alpinus TaxID=2014873 RepID=A0A402BH93_9CHLR|nr:aldo/keto reductase [Dictyobacter alpinus]GCE30781.1 glyceraldehyde 3-phosphate reductase [Dictyobacter alpinus]
MEQVFIEQPEVFNENRYEQMHYHRCGNSGLQLSAISLGAHETYGSYRDEAAARSCLYRAFDLGITHFDLANNYGRPPGAAEQLIGKILKAMPRDELLVSSKAGYRMWEGPYGEGLTKKSLVASLDQSLRRLQLDYVDIFYAHRPDPHTPLEETLVALDQLVRQGKVLYIGVSNFSGAQLEQAIQVAQHMHLTRILIHQQRYNIFERRCEQDLFEHTRSNGVGVIAFSPLSKGLLSDKYLGEELPAESRATHVWGKKSLENVASTEKREKVRRLNTIARQRGQTLPQMAIAWSLHHPAVNSVLIGASRIEQIEENVAALEQLDFSSDEIQAINHITDHD